MIELVLDRLQPNVACLQLRWKVAGLENTDWNLVPIDAYPHAPQIEQSCFPWLQLREVGQTNVLRLRFMDDNRHRKCFSNLVAILSHVGANPPHRSEQSRRDRDSRILDYCRFLVGSSEFQGELHRIM